MRRDNQGGIAVDTVELLKSIKILYAEDDEQAREELHDVLKRRAGKVIAAENGKQGLELYQDFQPDIILADLYMPEMDGIEMIRRIRSLKKGNPAVIVISAVNDVDTVLSAVDAGIDKYLLKPVNLKDLLQALTEMAQVIQARRHAVSASLPENKKQLEGEIKKQFAAFIKTTTGKGPRDIDVFIHDGQIEILASEVFTIFEKNLLDNYQNIAIIKHIRELFYSVKEADVCQLIQSVLGQEVRLKEVSINAEKDRNKLIFTMSQDV
nr:Na-translocating system protein MpsC family protein [Anaerovorax odorimutans]